MMDSIVNPAANAVATDCDAQKPSELPVPGIIGIGFDNPSKRVAEGKSYECRDAGNNSCIGQPPWHARQRSTAADC